MGDFPDLGAFLEHVSLVMDVEGPQDGPRVSIMTLHGAKEDSNSKLFSCRVGRRASFLINDPSTTTVGRVSRKSGDLLMSD